MVRYVYTEPTEPSLRLDRKVMVEASLLDQQSGTSRLGGGRQDHGS